MPTRAVLPWLIAIFSRSEVHALQVEFLHAILRIEHLNRVRLGAKEEEETLINGLRAPEPNLRAKT